MQQGQLPLFQRKSFLAVVSQPMTLLPPEPTATVLRTLPAYHAYLQSGGYSQYTPDDFHADVKKFALYTPGKEIQQLTPPDVQQWVGHLKTTERLSAKTVSRKLTALNNYFLWLITNGVITVNPAAGIYNKRVSSPLPDILFEDECQRLLTVASQDPRDYLFLLLLLETGIKTEEIFNLRLSHFDFSNKYAPSVWIKHTGKKVKKTRQLRLSADVFPVFTDYVQTYAIADLLFPLTPRFMRMQLRKVADQAHIQKEVSAQILRDTYAVRQLKQGQDIYAVLTKLGLHEKTWEDAKEKYEKLVSNAL